MQPSHEGPVLIPLAATRASVTENYLEIAAVCLHGGVELGPGHLRHFAVDTRFVLGDVVVALRHANLVTSGWSSAGGRSCSLVGIAGRRIAIVRRFSLGA